VDGTAFQTLAVLNGTAFYVLGICMASLALLVTALGLRNSRAFSSKAASRGLILLFLVLVLATTTFAVRYSRNEQADRRAKLAAEEAAEGATPISGGGVVPTPDAAALGGAAGPSTPPKQQQAAAQPAAKGPGGTLKLSADPTQIAYTTKSLSSKPGKVTIDFNNPAQIQHDVAIAKGNQQIAKSPLVAQGSTSVTAELSPGSYQFFCTVPGHREAGMLGTLTVK
jgi:plastocyanin